MRSVFWCVRVSFYGHTWADSKSWVNFGSSQFSLASSFLTVLHLTAGPESAVMFFNLLRLLGVGSQFNWSFCVVRQWRRWRGEIGGYFLWGWQSCNLLWSRALAFTWNSLAATCWETCVSCVSWLKPVRSCIGEGQIKDVVAGDTSCYLSFPLDRSLEISRLLSPEHNVQHLFYALW